jgi:hypothetical protein
MPVAVYWDIHHNYPLPYPVPKELEKDGGGTVKHYMSLQEAMAAARLTPITAAHQPSMAKRKAAILPTIGGTADHMPRAAPAQPQRHVGAVESRFDTIKYGKIRATVKCLFCKRPRCIYSDTAPSRMLPSTIEGEELMNPAAVKACRKMAVEVLHEAAAAPIYLCGMQPLDESHPFHGVFVTREQLDCDSPMEFEYYKCTQKNASWLNIKLCGHCGREEGELDKDACEEFKSVLQVCLTCGGAGALPLVRTKRAMGSAKLEAAKKAAARAAKAATPSSSTLPAPAVTSDAAPTGKGRGRGKGRAEGGRGRRGRGRRGG